MPDDLVKAPALGIGFARDYFFVFLKSYGSFDLVLRRGPLTLRQHGPRKPVHVQSEIIKPPQERIGGDRALFQHFPEVFRLGFQNYHVADWVKMLVLDGSLPPFGGVLVRLVFCRLIERRLPSAFNRLWIGVP